jgi:aspartyl-tRNA(Asn)/glutamyl-tRNA(Gln) amidotransferase subunit B
VVSDEGLLDKVVEKVIEENPKSVADYLAGKEKAVGFLMGQVMKETKGKANPQIINGLIKDKLDAMKGM